MNVANPRRERIGFVEKNNCAIVKLGKGEVAIYNFGSIKLHAYKTNDPIDDEVFVVEKNGCGFVIEYPCFFDNIRELEGYIAEKGLRVEGILAAYHMAGATFLAGTSIYATASADAYGHEGGGRALIDNFASAFGDAFDSSIPTVTNVVEGGPLILAGIEVSIVPNDEAFDVAIPEINCVYTHMLGHDCHSIVAGSGHADAIIAQFEGYLRSGVDLVLTSHYTPEDLKDVRVKISYLEDLKAIAETSSDAESFKAKVSERYPEYSGSNYLDMTASFFFSE